MKSDLANKPEPMSSRSVSKTAERPSYAYPADKAESPKTMPVAAANLIRERVLSGEYVPGFQLRQDVLAAEFGMSRIPIREALFLLESEGVVRILPHKGAIVTELTVPEIEELYTIRTLLEPHLLERSAPHLDESDFSHLDLAFKQYTASIEKDESANWNKLNTTFHMTLYRHAESPRVLSLINSLLRECDIHTRFQLTNFKGDRARAVAEHAELIQLCKDRRFEDAAKLLREHIDHARVVLVELLRSRQK